MDILKRHGLKLPALFISFVFIQSLFFKFTRHPETINIFEAKLEPWAASLGFPGLFVPGGIFSAYVIGSAELVASALLLYGTFAAGRHLFQGLGALLALGVISGAIFFHLTKLGIVVQDDGGQLFAMALAVFVGAAFVLLRTWRGLLEWLPGARSAQSEQG